MPLLEVRNLQKSFSGRRVVDAVDFHVSRSEIVGLLGPNGAGKTTTFRMVMGMIRPEKGEVKLDGNDLSRLPMFKRARRGMGYLSQEPSIFRNLTVEDNIMAILETQPLSRRERQERLAELLADLGLSRVSQSLARTLSGGERRRLEISRALVTNPEILLLDEPFSGVDPRACADIQKIIASLRLRGMSILITDHNVFETFTIADRVYIIHDGRVLKHGSPEELINDKQAQRLYLGEKFDEFGEAFQRLRSQISRREHKVPAPRIGRTTQMIRIEEAQHRREKAQEVFPDGTTVIPRPPQDGTPAASTAPGAPGIPSAPSGPSAPGTSAPPPAAPTPPPGQASGKPTELQTGEFRSIPPGSKLAVPPAPADPRKDADTRVPEDTKSAPPPGDNPPRSEAEIDDAADAGNRS